MAKASAKGAYFGLSWLISVILAIIPITNLVFGIVIRAQKNNLLGVVLNILLCPIFWIVDLFTVIFQNKIIFLA